MRKEAYLAFKDRFRLFRFKWDSRHTLSSLCARGAGVRIESPCPALLTGPGPIHSVGGQQ